MVTGKRRRLTGAATVQPSSGASRKVATLPDAGHGHKPRHLLWQLLAPQQSGERPAHHHRLISIRRRRGQLGVELVGLGPPLGDHPVEPGAEQGLASSLAGFAGRSRSRSSAVVPGCTLS
jgi:hypothetical protein